MGLRIILDIDSKKNTDILISLLKSVNFIKHIETQEKSEILTPNSMKKVAFGMSSQSLKKFFKNEKESIF